MDISSCIKNTNLEFSSDCSLSQGNQMHYTFYIIYDYCYICFHINYKLSSLLLLLFFEISKVISSEQLNALVFQFSIKAVELYNCRNSNIIPFGDPKLSCNWHYLVLRPICPVLSVKPPEPFSITVLKINMFVHTFF